MTLAVRERVLQAALAKLAAISAVAGLKVERNRSEPVDAWPCLLLLDGDQVTDAGQTGFVLHEMNVSVLGFVRGTAKADIGPDLNALYGATVAVLTSDPSLGAVAVDVIEGEMTTLMDPAEDIERQAQFDLKFTITYATRHGDPFSIGP